VTIGHFVGLTLPARPIAFAAAIAFLLFAAWTWRDSRGGDDEVAAVPEPRYVIFAVISSFVLAELGDKTMLATIALASDHNWAGVWIGATVGMVLADGVAIVAGRLLHRRLPERFLHEVAALLFLLFGLWLLFDNALGWLLGGRGVHRRGCRSGRDHRRDPVLQEPAGCPGSGIVAGNRCIAPWLPPVDGLPRS